MRRNITSRDMLFNLNVWASVFTTTVEFLDWKIDFKYINKIKLNLNFKLKAKSKLKLK